ncbi:hypothetical protein EJ08DRAFT_704696 [Tothia fuscella]|uniref:Secreted protein n=1 Tax=Tothia fuscella TaxID=1048955 RepID=A0A9P4U4K7_9PEZI|nr:hypothetical protein EJ08DRAFT_704696 [Tothia fuscella]
MQLPVTTMILSLLSSLVSAGCFPHGTEGDKALGRTGVQTICNVLFGAYESGEHREECSSGIGNNKWFFQVKKISGGTGTLTKEACVSGLEQRVNGCDRGGEHSYTNWYYKADPNSGECRDNSVNKEEYKVPTKKVKRFTTTVM